MAEYMKTFRSTFGLDAGGQKVENVGFADKTVGTDGVSVNFLIDRNTLQQYVPTRGYDKDFSVIYDRKIWTAKNDIANPAGDFDFTKWVSIDTSPIWIPINTVSISNQLESGNYYEIDSNVGPMNLSLPERPNNGDMIVVRDKGGMTGFNECKIDVSGTKILQYDGNVIEDYLITVPYSDTTIIYNNNIWIVYPADFGDKAVYVSANGDVLQKIQANQKVMRKTATGIIHLQLPRYANHGDTIYTYDLDGMNEINHSTVSVVTGSGMTVEGKPTVESRKSGSGIFVYDATEKNWEIYDNDLRQRMKVVSGNTNIYPFDYVAIISTTPTVLTLPTDVSEGDTVKVNLRYMKRGGSCTVKVHPDTTDSMWVSKSYLQFPYGKDLPPSSSTFPTIKEFTINAGEDYLTNMTLSYVEDTADTGYWLISDNDTVVERVDATNRSRMGVAALATQDEVNKNHEQNPADDLIVTPKTLANKTSTETRRGISRIATAAEVQLVTGGAHLNDVIVTPKRLNERQATETIRGLAEIATQAEANGSTDDLRIITAKKLHARKASETQTGILPLVQSGGVPGTARDEVGTFVYNDNEHTRAVTAKTLSQRVAKETDSGIGYVATQGETNAGTADLSTGPLFVTAAKLHARKATTSMWGLAEIATQTEVNAGTDTIRYVTPDTLDGRRASETLAGIAEFATQAEFDAGNGNTIARPSVIKTFFSRADRFGVSAAAGLTMTGNAWSGIDVAVEVPTTTQRGTARTATQAEASAMTGALDNVIVTPATLNGRKSTTALDGIIRCTTNAEATAGSATNLAITPATLKATAASDGWIATDSRRGFVKTGPTSDVTWVGNQTAGSTKAYTAYVHEGYAVTPRGLNFAIQNYLPKLATAQNSLKLGGVVAANWMRRDIDQTHLGSVHVTNELSAESVNAAHGRFEGVDITDTNDHALTIGTKDAVGTTGIILRSKEGSTNNHWKIKCSSSALRFYDTDKDDGADSENLRIDRSGNIVAQASIYSQAGNFIASNIAGKLYIGGTASANQVVAATAGDAIFGNGSKQTLLNSKGINNLVHQYGSTASVILHTGNYASHIDGRYVNVAGDTMTGDLKITSGRAIKTTSGENLIRSGGGGNSTVFGNTVEPTYIDAINDQSFFARVAGSSATKKFYHEGHKPTPAEIGAISTVNGQANNITLSDYIQIGKCRIVVNNATKSVDFQWID